MRGTGDSRKAACLDAREEQSQLSWQGHCCLLMPATCRCSWNVHTVALACFCVGQMEGSINNNVVGIPYTSHKMHFYLWKIALLAFTFI